MYNIRVRYTRGEEVKFISHLDLMKAFERAIRRSKLPIGYSKGFNPHPHMVFGLPLSVGVTSDCEYADFEMAEGINPEILPPSAFMDKLNEALPYGIRIKAALLKTTGSNIMADIEGATYDIEVYTDSELTTIEAECMIEQLMPNPELIVVKETKGEKKDKDIRSLIRTLKIAGSIQQRAGYDGFASAFLLQAFVDAGSRSNLSPMLIVSAINKYTEMRVKSFRTHRTGLFALKGDSLTDPLLLDCKPNLTEGKYI